MLTLKLTCLQLRVVFPDDEQGSDNLLLAPKDLLIAGRVGLEERSRIKLVLG